MTLIADDVVTLRMYVMHFIFLACAACLHAAKLYIYIRQVN